MVLFSSVWQGDVNFRIQHECFQYVLEGNVTSHIDGDVSYKPTGSNFGGRSMRSHHTDDYTIYTHNITHRSLIEIDI